MDIQRSQISDLVFASCWETSSRVLICSETTPTARKAAQARPAPRPKRLVNVEAIQSVLSTLVDFFCSCTLAEKTGVGCSDKLVLSCGDGGGCGCEGGVDGGGGVCDEEEM